MPDPKVEIVGIRELRLGEVLTMSYPGQPVLGTKQVVPMFLETMDPKTGEKVELKLALSMEQLAELQARAAKASTGTEYIGRLQFFGPLRVGDSGLSTNIYKPLSFLQWVWSASVVNPETLQRMLGNSASAASCSFQGCSNFPRIAGLPR